jgi:hypothetical protein
MYAVTVLKPYRRVNTFYSPLDVSSRVELLQCFKFTGKMVKIKKFTGKIGKAGKW